MKLGVHRETLAASLRDADESWFHAPEDLGWDLAAAVQPLGARAHCIAGVDSLVADLAAQLRSGDQVLVMSNGGFGGLHAKLLDALRTREAA